jgi:hypothetical protein
VQQTNEDKLNVCVDIYGLMGKFGKTKVAKGTAGLILLALLVLTILAFILGWTLVVFSMYTLNIQKNDNWFPFLNCVLTIMYVHVYV